MSQRIDPDTGLTPIAKQICVEYAKNPADITAAAQKARGIVSGIPYATDRAAATVASRVLSRANSRRYLAVLAAQHRVTPGRVFHTLDKALDAEKTLISPKGDFIGKEEDHNIRLRAADMSAKILGLYQAPGSQGNAAADDDIIDITPEDAEALLGE